MIFCKEKSAVRMNGGSVWARAGKDLGVFQKESWLRDGIESLPGLPRSPPLRLTPDSLLTCPPFLSLVTRHLPRQGGMLGEDRCLSPSTGSRSGCRPPVSQDLCPDRTSDIAETVSFSGYRQAGPAWPTFTLVVAKDCLVHLSDHTLVFK